MNDFDLQATRERIRSANDIVDVVGDYVRLQRSGKTWKGLCPFHTDRRPSFHVNPQLQIYKCWSCGEGGDVFTFIQKKENLEFVDALELLARRAGIAIDRRGFSKEKASERQEMLELNGLAAAFFKERLTKSGLPSEYLASRAILRETRDRFGLGYAPDEWGALVFHLEKRRVNLQLAARAGLIRARQGEGGYYDAFRNRLIFPIHDIHGQVIGFGGRTLGDDPA
ncbi:MAG TPA: CHC2 zinc finger domain-containing protein, partial [Chthonomonadales bacterium]|nr:CHC2 zinc finger domain-containing protein [Chthonomonadales bacterium]